VSEEIPRFSSDTPLLFLGGPANKRVEDWGLVPRGRWILMWHEGEKHSYCFRFVLSPDATSVDVVLADYEGIVREYEPPA
jgi:hypothetical protein